MTNKFYPKYCVEDLSIFTDDIHTEVDKKVAIPMVCFCDIQLSQIQKHIGFYGKYAIGLKKEWGIKNKISPLFYTHGNAYTAGYLKKIRMDYGKRPNDLYNDHECSHISATQELIEPSELT